MKIQKILLSIILISLAILSSNSKAADDWNLGYIHVDGRIWYPCSEYCADDSGDEIKVAIPSIKQTELPVKKTNSSLGTKKLLNFDENVFYNKIMAECKKFDENCLVNDVF